jgi:hypothetical protein
MKNLLLGRLPVALTFTAMLFSQAGTAQTTTQYNQFAPLSDTRVVDSWMQPAASRVRTITTSGGSTESVVEPLIMERHERVVVPITETTTTTVVGHEPSVTTEEVSHTQTRSTGKTRVAPRVTRLAHSPHRLLVAHKYSHTKRAIAYRPTVRRDHYVVRRTTTQGRQVIQQNQRTEQKSMIMDRRDPALDRY